MRAVRSHPTLLLILALSHIRMRLIQSHPHIPSRENDELSQSSEVCSTSLSFAIFRRFKANLLAQAELLTSLLLHQQVVLSQPSADWPFGPGG